MNRCPWSEQGGNLYLKYHDEEWGVPLHDDIRHFEHLVMEINQCGLSWLSILKRREHLREAYHGFDPALVALLGDGDVSRLIENPGIIRNRRKIDAIINNARQFIGIQEEFGSFDSYLWAYVDYEPFLPVRKNQSDVPSSTPLSDRISSDLKKRGFRFVGSTNVYAYIQAAGLVNDHIEGCFRCEELKRHHGAAPIEFHARSREPLNPA